MIFIDHFTYHRCNYYLSHSPRSYPTETERDEITTVKRITSKGYSSFQAFPSVPPSTKTFTSAKTFHKHYQSHRSINDALIKKFNALFQSYTHFSNFLIQRQKTLYDADVIKEKQHNFPFVCDLRSADRVGTFASK